MTGHNADPTAPDDALTLRERGVSMIEHRRREVRTITRALLGLKSLAVAGAVVPVVDDIVGGLVVAVLVAAAVAVVLRVVARRVRWWFEDRADERVAAAWRAEHEAPPVIRPVPAETARRSVLAGRAGVPR